MRAGRGPTGYKWALSFAVHASRAPLPLCGVFGMDAVDRISVSPPDLGVEAPPPE